MSVIEVPRKLAEQAGGVIWRQIDLGLPLDAKLDPPALIALDGGFGLLVRAIVGDVAAWRWLSLGPEFSPRALPASLEGPNLAGPTLVPAAGAVIIAGVAPGDGEQEWPRLGLAALDPGTLGVSPVMTVGEPDPALARGPWPVAIRDQSLVLLPSLAPTLALGCDPATNALTLLSAHDAPVVAERMRGCAPLMPFGSEGGWLGLALEQASYPMSPDPAGAPQGQAEVTQHRFVAFDRDLRIARLSHPFTFGESAREACAGMALLGDRIALVWSDGGAIIPAATLPAEEVERLLLPAESPDFLGIRQRWVFPPLPLPLTGAERPRETLEQLLAPVDPLLPMQAWPMMPVLHPVIAPLQRALTQDAPVVREIAFGRPPDAPELSVIVPIYRDVHYVAEQIAAFVSDPEHDPSRVELIYVLDSPEDEDALIAMAGRMLREHGLPMRLLIGARNTGYSHANNLGAVHARGDYLLLLNVDAWPATPGWVSRLLDFARSTPGAGMIGVRQVSRTGETIGTGKGWLQLIEPPVWEAAAADVPLGAPAVVAGVDGPVMLISRERYLALGGLSEQFVVGQCEDLDLWNRLRTAGYDLWHLPDVEFTHDETGVFQTSSAHGRFWLYNTWLLNERWDRWLRLNHRATLAPPPAPEPPLLPATWQEVLDAPAFIINLDRTPERWGPVREAVEAAGYRDIRRVSAVDGNVPGAVERGWDALGNPRFRDDCDPRDRLAGKGPFQGAYLSPGLL
ncbi:MAG: glycosyltransferase family 2 protein, partial [Thermomicrobiales bacterium]